MSMSDKYLAYLNQNIEIAPANSEEEVQAANLIQQIMEADGLSTEQQDFQAPNDTTFVAGILEAVFVVGVVLAGIGGIAMAVLGFVVAALAFALLALRFVGHDLIGAVLPRAHSQNVIGLHKGEGPASGRGVRPIVVMAHYDTGREELLSRPSIARYRGTVTSWAPYGAVVAALCTVLQLVVALPEPALRILWVIGMVCALPTLALAVNNIAVRFMPLTAAANDNNASVAALLGVMEDVCTTDPVKQAERMAALEAAVEAAEVDEGLVAPEPQEAVRVVETVVEEPEPIVGVRHGKAVLEALGMLPESCQIVYVRPTRTVRKVEAVEEAVEDAPVAAPAPVAVPGFLRNAPSVPEKDEPQPEPEAWDAPSVGEPQPRSQRHEPESEALSSQFQSTGRILNRSAARDQATWADTPVEAAAVGVPSQAEAVTDDARDQVTWADTPVDAAMAVDSVATSEVAAAEAAGPDEAGSTQQMPVQVAEAPAEPVDDPQWGQTSFRPREVSVARRASLFDLPDPTEAEVDPLAPDFEMPTRQPPLEAETFSDADYELPGQARPRQAQRGATVTTARRTVQAQSAGGAVRVQASQTVTTVTGTSQEAQGAAQAIEPVAVEHEATRAHHGEKGAKPSLRERLHLGRKGQALNQSDWVDDGWDDQDGWKGGAARSQDADVTDDEMADAVLDMDYVNLVAHDIWFVATGASELDHAGSRAFIDAHKKDLRGAFLVNLDSVGAGDLTLLTEEGFGVRRHVDRRLLKMLDRIARDLHIHLQDEPRAWADTDATPAMRRSVRSATLMGCDLGAVPALAHTDENVPENVDAAQVAQVNRLVSELIRRA